MPLPCAGKCRFWTKGEAKRWARLKALRSKDKRLRAYHCPHCGMHHLTSANRKALSAAKRGQ